MAGLHRARPHARRGVRPARPLAAAPRRGAPRAQRRRPVQPGRAPVPAETVLAADHGVAKADVWRRVTATGRYDGAHAMVVRNRTLEGSPGFQVLVPLQIAAGPAVLVNRGWVPVGDRAGTCPPCPRPRTASSPWSVTCERARHRTGEPRLPPVSSRGRRARNRAHAAVPVARRLSRALAGTPRPAEAPGRSPRRSPRGPALLLCASVVHVRGDRARRLRRPGPARGRRRGRAAGQPAQPSRTASGRAGTHRGLRPDRRHADGRAGRPRRLGGLAVPAPLRLRRLLRRAPRRRRRTATGGSRPTAAAAAPRRALPRTTRSCWRPTWETRERTRARHRLHAAARRGARRRAHRRGRRGRGRRCAATSGSASTTATSCRGCAAIDGGIACRRRARTPSGCAQPGRAPRRGLHDRRRRSWSPPASGCRSC